MDNVANSLEQMGIEVETMPAINRRFHENKIWQFYRIVQQNRKGSKFWEQEQWLRARLKKKNLPTILLCLTQSISEDLLLHIQNKGIITVAWWGDTPGNMIGKGLACAGWDFIYIKDKNAAKKLKGLGLNAALMHEAMNPFWHKPSFQEIKNFMVIAGSFYDYRNYMTHQLIKKNIPVKLFGRKLPKWAYKNIKQKHSNKYIVKEEKSKYFGEAIACVNSTAMSEFDSLNCRAFEIAGAKGLQFLEYRPAVEDCFEIDKEIKVFHTLEELEDLYYWALKDPKSGYKIREAGYKRALAEHTYQHRIKTILKNIQ